MSRHVLLAERKIRRDARNRLRLAGMYPTGDDAQMKRLSLIKEIKSLQPVALMAVTAKTRWG